MTSVPTARQRPPPPPRPTRRKAPPPNGNANAASEAQPIDGSDGETNKRGARASSAPPQDAPPTPAGGGEGVGVGVSVNVSDSDSSTVPSIMSSGVSGSASESPIDAVDPPPGSVKSNGGGKMNGFGGEPAAAAESSSSPAPPDSMSAAADLISTLDTAFAEMSSSAASASMEAEGARRNAKMASEVARRYANRSYVRGTGGAGTSSPAAKQEMMEAYRPRREVAAAAGSPARGDKASSSAAGGAVAGAPRPYNYAEPLQRLSLGGDRGSTPQKSSPIRSRGREMDWRPPLQPAAALERSPISPTKNSRSLFRAVSPGSAKKRKNLILSTARSEPRGTPAAVSGSPFTKMSPGSRERIARSHAEDVLSISLELERTRQALEAERTAHDQARDDLVESRAQNVRLEEDVQRLLSDMESERESHGREMNSAECELNRARTRIAAAEEDANLALDLAKGSAESREQVEAWLTRALDEIETLRNRLSITMGEEQGLGVAPTPATKASAPATPAALPLVAVLEEDVGNAVAVAPPVDAAFPKAPSGQPIAVHIVPDAAGNGGVVPNHDAGL